MLVAAVGLALAAGCAEVTQEEPESFLGLSGAGGDPTGTAGQGMGGTVPGVNVPSGSAGLGGASRGGSGGSFPGSNAGGASGSAAQGGSPTQTAGGSSASGQGGTAPDLGPQFPSGMELFRDDFESDDVSRWAVADGTWARTVDAETGSNVFAQTDTSPSTAVLAVSGDASWRDVRVEADFKVLTFNGSSSSYLAGLCVRLTDADNFYMVGLRSDGNQTIGIRKFGSSNTNLSQSELSGAENVWYRLRVDAIGSTLSVYIDGALVLEQTDAEHGAGGIGLCTVRASALFDNVVVTAP